MTETNIGPRVDRTKIRIAEIEGKLGAQSTGEEPRACIRALVILPRKLSNHIKSQLSDPACATKREIICPIVERMETWNR